MNQKGFISFPIIFAIIFLLGVGGYFAFGPKLNTKRNSVACTLEAKICPDGSAVGRSGPNCAFAVCLGVATTTVSQIDASGWKTYTNEIGGYLFNYPNEWNVATNQYNSKNALFGIDASSNSGLGGVEIFNNQPSIENFLGGVEAQYSNKVNFTVDGVLGIRAQYKSTGGRSGGQATLLKNGDIYNIYINSEKEEDVKIFDQILSTFKFISPSLGSTPRIIDHFACSDYCPGPRESYMIKIYEGVTDEATCKNLGGTIYTYYGWGKFTVCKAQ